MKLFVRQGMGDGSGAARLVMNNEFTLEKEVQCGCRLRGLGADQVARVENEAGPSDDVCPAVVAQHEGRRDRRRTPLPDAAADQHRRVRPPGGGSRQSPTVFAFVLVSLRTGTTCVLFG